MSQVEIGGLRIRTTPAGYDTMPATAVHLLDPLNVSIVSIISISFVLFMFCGTSAPTSFLVSNPALATLPLYKNKNISRRIQEQHSRSDTFYLYREPLPVAIVLRPTANSSSQLPGNRRHPTPSSHMNTQQPARGPNAGLPAFHDNNTRASVRLPAVRGTTEHTIQVIQPATGKVSYAVPIRDPTAYSGSGVSSRQDQARTVLNDPHQDRNSTSEPSSTVMDANVTGSTLRAQAPSYDFVATQRRGKSAIGSLETFDLDAAKKR